jgi:hypothetical protein
MHAKIQKYIMNDLASGVQSVVIAHVNLDKVTTLRAYCYLAT